MTYTIKELADLFGITTNKARFYEKKGLIKPKREDNDYRFYTEEDVLKIQTILMYRSLGMPIEHIKKIMLEDENSYIERFHHLWKLTNDELQRLSSIKSTLEKIMDEIYETDQQVMNNKIMSFIQEDQKIFDIKSGWEDKWNFDNWAKTYDQSIDHFKGQDGIYQSYDDLLDEVTKIASEDMTSDHLVLDIGVGTGNLTQRLLKKNLSVVGVDQSRNMLCEVKRKLPQLKVRLGDFMNLPFSDQSFDRIATTYAFHHLEDHEKEIALKEMSRVIKSNGKIVIGDMMFESTNERQRLMSLMTEEEVEEVNDEYYSNIEHLKEAGERIGLSLKYYPIDKICWVVVLEK